ncbi:MvaI/BcnI family restriction endonuclease [Solimicrobium silvestre]|uniref:MvaI/BcnI restriction endonuclease domain-containing protein n=1 Tax=Solimicrobium silvestre TaxID=2099400 RepID=A0A2S9H3F8_9BURK|nr:MvaI/BcnI family restriction endonuclease [Solimicrobium silvestre]PRC94396.1 hypothetical protein S2091_1017 [Solimicrobium silvestre]
MAAVQGTYDTQSSKQITMSNITRIFHDLGVVNIYVKKLASNDNSKNQPFFGSHLTDLSFLPTGEMIASNSESQKTLDPKRKIKYQTNLKLSWVDAEGKTYAAPNSKLIYYPQYPEVRFSGFLSGSKADISKWMAPEKQGRSEGRWLLLGVSKDNSIYAYLATPESDLSKELANANYIKISTIFWQLNTSHIATIKSTKEALKTKLLEIHNMGWVASQKLSSEMVMESYKAANGGGYTLEALLGISPNGIAEPDYLGWEVKQFGVTKFPRTGSKPTTLMTPEPNGGFYTEHGAMEFVRTFGYPDKSGKEDRINFGGKHIVDQYQNLTGLTLHLNGYDPALSKITDANGVIALLDKAGNVSASWSFAKLMDHWKRKHSQAVYIPCLRRSDSGTFQYSYGKDIELGEGTNFEKFLVAMHKGDVYYDPGIKLEMATGNSPKLKRRSQFRVNHKDIGALYKKFELIDLCE